MTNQPSEDSRSGKYQGKFLKNPAAAAGAEDGGKKRKSRRGLLALLILLLFAVRFGAEAAKALTIADRYGNGARMLIYGDVARVELGDAIRSNDGEKVIQIVDELPENMDPEEDVIVRQDEGATLIYHGHTYRLNQNLATVLFLGVDKQFTEEDNLPGSGGQSDVLLLIGIDTKTGRGTILNINRDTKAEVDEYTVGGSFNRTVLEQITLAYAYGDGHEKSCENTMTTVSRLLYSLPISTYVALDMEGVDAANEAVGGVRVKSLLSFEQRDGTTVHEGDLITLHGYSLNRYIRKRSQDVDANVARMDRQKQFVTEFTKTVIRQSKGDLTFPVDLFSALSPYMITDMELPDVTFLSSCFLQHGANFSFRSIDGTYTTDSEGHSLFLPDEVDLFEAVLQVFYVQAD